MFETIDTIVTEKAEQTFVDFTNAQIDLITIDEDLMKRHFWKMTKLLGKFVGLASLSFATLGLVNLEIAINKLVKK